MKSKRLIPSVVLALVASAAPAWAQTRSSSYQGVAVQKRKFELGNELRLALGVLPVDPYQKGYSASLSFTRHLGEYWAWEIFQVTGALLTSTDLRDELIDVFARDPSEFSAPRFVATTGLELTPFYGKWAFLNNGMVHNSFLIGGYAGVIFGDRGDIGETFKDVRPSVGLGLGYRFFLSPTWSTRLDWRTFYSRRLYDVGESQNADDIVMLITLSMSLNFGVDR